MVRTIETFKPAIKSKFRWGAYIRTCHRTCHNDDWRSSRRSPPHPTPFPKGTHHSKFALLFASGGRGLRVMIATANFIQIDWENKTEASWKRRGLFRVWL